MRRARPLHFLTLLTPVGIAFGYITGAFGYFARDQGVPADVIAAIIAASFVPHGIKFLWAPLVDLTLNPKRWYLIALTLSMVGLAAVIIVPVRADAVPRAEVVFIASQIGLTLLMLSCEALMANALSEKEKGRAAGYYQAGYMASNAFGGFGAIELHRLGASPAQIALGACGLSVLAALPVLFIPAPTATPHEGPVLEVLRRFWKDVWNVLSTRMGVTGMIIALVPVGAGALGSMFTTLAPDWGLSGGGNVELLGFTVSAEHVVGVMIAGSANSVIQAAGSLLGGQLADRINRRVTYGIAGSLMAISALAMALSPRSPLSFIVWASLYNLFYGLAFTAFSAFVLETIGRGAGASKYNIFAGLSNLAISYVIRADGWGYGRLKPLGALYMDAALTGVGVVVLVAVVLLLRRRPAHLPLPP